MTDPAVFRERGPGGRWTQRLSAASGIHLTLPARFTGDRFVTHLCGHEYNTSLGTFLIPNVSLDSALTELRDLADNRSIRGHLVWREVTVTVTEWKTTDS